MNARLFVSFLLASTLTGCNSPSGSAGQPPEVAATATAVEAEPMGPSTPWQPEFFNYASADGDLVIEGPCGSRFAFRKIETRTANYWLAPGEFLVGQSADASASESRLVTENVRRSAVVGAFSIGDDPTDRYYFLGKYEVTRDQYQAVMGDSCPNPSVEGSYPVDKVSRFDAIQFTRRLTEWILQHGEARAGMPVVDGQTAYVRLPSEAEWEFAARGGNVVSDEERLAPVYPMDDLPSAFEWYRGDDSCRGQIQPVGYLRPNPLGLHDMLGNVHEIVADAFQLSVNMHLHGQVGALIVKGGSCDTYPEDLRSAARLEMPEYDRDQGIASAPEMVGFRLALGAPAISSNTRLKAYEKDYTQLTKLTTGDDPVADLRKLAEAQDEPKVTQTLKRIAGEVEHELVKRTLNEAANARALVATCSLMIRNYRAAARQAARLEQALSTAEELPDTMEGKPGIIKNTRVGLAGAQATMKISRQLYASALVSASDTMAEGLLRDAALRVGKDFADLYRVDGNQMSVSAMACLFARQTAHYREHHPAQLDDYFDEMVAASDATILPCK